MRIGNRSKGFTLAELLIALGILGVIATFTIPKVLQTQQEARSKSIVKEAAGAISEAYVAYKRNTTPASGTTAGDLASYFNYVAMDTASQVDDVENWPDLWCSNADKCLKMHSGAMIRFRDCGFGGTANTNTLIFEVDPDGVYGGSTTGASKSVMLFLMYDGRVSSRGKEITTITSSCGTWGPDATADPSWFTW